MLALLNKVVLKWKLKKAIELARKGYSAHEIAEILKIPYSLAKYAEYLAYMTKGRVKL